jgi:hypothetical protein
MGRPKMTLKEMREKHGSTVDPSDPSQRTRYWRMMDALYAAGIKLEDKNLNDVARGTARSAASDYLDRTGGKATTPIEQTTTVIHKSPEDAAKSLFELLHSEKPKEVVQPQTDKPETIQ